MAVLHRFYCILNSYSFSNFADSKKLVLEVGCSDVAHVRDLELPIMTGFLMKQTSSILFKTWKKRYFILRRDNCLYYYKTEKVQYIIKPMAEFF